MTRLSVIVSPPGSERQSTEGPHVDRTVHSIRRGAAITDRGKEVWFSAAIRHGRARSYPSVENIAFGKTVFTGRAQCRRVAPTGDMIAFLEDDGAGGAGSFP